MGVKIQRPGEPGHPGSSRRIYVRVNYKGLRRTRVFNSTKGAERYATDVEAMLKLGKVDDVFTEPEPPVSPDPGPTFGQYWAKWFALEQAGWKPRTILTYNRIFNSHLKTWADRLLTAISRQEIKDLLAAKLVSGNLLRVGKPMETNSVRSILAPLRKCLQAAVDDGLIAANPASRVKVHRRKDRTPDDALERYTREELAQILQTVQTHMLQWYPGMLTAARTGLRVGELCGLRVEDLNFPQRYIHVRRAISRRIEGTPKNGKDRRVDMSEQLAAVLQDHLRNREITATVAGQTPSPWVFGSLETGRPLCDEFLAKQAWPRATRLAGVRPLKFHALRHTFCSLLIEQGESLAYVRDQAGHSSIQTTADTYAHLVPGSNRAAVNRLDDPVPMRASEPSRNLGATEPAVQA
jgi:integrase